MIHPVSAEEALNQIVMAIYALGIGIAEIVVLPPEPDQTDRLQQCIRAAETIALLGRSGVGVIQHITPNAPPPC